MRGLDLFCGAGGASKGYVLARAKMMGVDIRPQPNYPYTFIQGDALWPPVDLDAFDFIHASPPCQRWAEAGASRRLGTNLPDLLTPTRMMLEAWGGPYVIENIPTAPMPEGFVLCGRTFGLPLIRHRRFETKPRLVLVPSTCRQRRFARSVDHGPSAAPYARKSWERRWRSDVLPVVWPWMTLSESGEAIPPAYTQFIGEQLFAQIGRDSRADVRRERRRRRGERR